MSASPLVLEALPDPQRAWVATAAVPVELAARQILAEPGEPAEAIWLLTDAIAARIAIHRHGASQEAGLNGAGTLACAFALVGGGLSPWRVEVRRGGSALMLDARWFGHLDEQAPALRHIAQSTAAVEALQLAGSFAVRSCRSARTCVAERLLDYFETFGEPVLPFTHERLAELLSIRRATVTLALQELEAERAIRARRGAIELVNPDRLAALSRPR